MACGSGSQSADTPTPIATHVPSMATPTPVAEIVPTPAATAAPGPTATTVPDDAQVRMQTE